MCSSRWNSAANPAGKRKPRSILAQVGLADRLEHYPLQLSGGEQQRVALARAFIHRPKILFADEPTGNLDAETSEPIVEMLFRLNREAGTALVLVTHDPVLAARARRVVKMRGGTIVDEEEHAPAAELAWIAARRLHSRAGFGRRFSIRGRGGWRGATAARSGSGSRSFRSRSSPASPRWWRFIR